MLLNHSRHLARLRTVLFTATALVGLSSAAAADQFDPQRDPQIVIADPGTPVSDRDPVNVTGVGQMIIDEQNGFIGLCTGTLINPRTVIFAAHCVNERAASAYGAANGGQPIGFGFGNNNNAAGASAFGGWLNGISGGPKYQTNISRNMYNVSQVVYNPLSTEPAAASFLYGDVAMATLDTVAANVPTWNLMFSKLAAPTITAAGTGYHVVIDGYGNNGTGTTGSTGGIDFRRRVAANTLGALASLNDFEGFLFGVQDNLPQNLYWIDFDDPRRGTPQASPFDFNAWRDNAVPNEGITAAGDSGGPLILDSTFSKQVVLAVLSGGYTRFFNGQPANGYGTASFYQPLYLYWDWIAANNHYHYTAAVAGNGSWTDPAHWVTTLDPNYQVISNGQVVNGIPTTLGGQNVDTSGKFGQACFQSGGVSDCYDTATGVETIQTKPIGTAADGSLGNDMGFTSAGDLGGTVDQATLTGGASAQSLVDPVAPAPQAPGGPLPAATVANGLPGATNFVPNNSAGSPTVAAQYYDVTLSAAGTTTLSGATIVIDRLALQNSAGLDIQATGSLTSNIDVTMFSTSTLNVAGTLRTADLTMGGGTLTGTGTIVLNAGGTVFPSATALLTVGNGARVSGGTVGTAGTLTVTGNMLMALASTTVVDKSPTATDRINVSGVLGVNGTLLYSSVGGYVPQFTDTAVIASATTITGSFASVPDTVTGVLFPVVTKVTVGGTQQEVLSFQAASFLTQLTGATSDQTTLANALDALRATNYNDLAALYQAIDPLTDGPLGQALENLAPDAQRAVSGLLDMQSENYGDFLFEHLGSAGSEGAGQEVAFRFNADGLGMALANQSGTAASLPFLALGQNAASLEPARVMPAGLSDLGLSSAFLDGGVLNGDIEIGGGGGKADVDGFQIGAGVDRKNVLPGLTLGAAIGIAQSTTTLAATPSMIQIGAYEGAIFGRYDWADSWTAQGFMAFATQSIQTRRTVVVGATTFNLAGHTHGFAPTYGVLVGKTFVADNVTITPQARLRYLQSSVDGYTETGGAPAMTFSSIDTDSVLASFGAVAEVDADMGGIGLKPSARAFFVHRVGGREGLVTSAFAGAPGTLLTFPVADETQDWGELGVGLEADMTEHFGHPSSLSFRYDTTVGRDNISYGTWSGNITIHL